jgi:steroid delta-isomerase-like uncharacterized protein
MKQVAEQPLVKWAEFWSSHDTGELLSLFTDDCVYEDVTLGVINRGKAELRTFADSWFAACPDLHVDLRSRFAAGEWAAMEWVVSGTQHGDLPGMPATHKSFSVRGASVAQIAGERIRRISDYWDLNTFLKQLGLMPNG